MRRRKPFRAIAVATGLLFVTVVSAVGHQSALRSGTVYGDENDWITRSYFLRLTLNHDFRHPLWTGVDGIDQPHVTDFVVGLGLIASGRPLPEVPSISRSWFNSSLPYGEKLRAGRRPCAVLGTLVAPLLFCIGLMATRRLAVGLVAGLLYALHPLALEWQSRAMSDGPTVFTSILALTLLQSFVCTNPLFAPVPRGSTRYVARLALCGFACGLAVATKLNGYLVAICPVATLGLAILRAVVLRRGDVRQVARLSAAYGAVFVVSTITATVALNPTLYHSPVRTMGRMLAHRWETTGHQQKGFPTEALPELSQRVERLFQALLWTYPEVPSDLFSMIHLNLAGLGLAVMAVRVARAGGDSETWARSIPMLVWTLTVGAVMTPMVFMHWPRYYLLHVTCWELLTGVGLVAAVDSFARLLQRRRRPPPAAEAVPHFSSQADAIDPSRFSTGA